MENVAGTSVPLRRHGDEFERLPNGYYKALGRCDDTMNLGGIKASLSCNLCRSPSKSTSHVCAMHLLLKFYPITLVRMRRHLNRDFTVGGHNTQSSLIFKGQGSLCHQVSSVELERACVESVSSIIEAAAVGVPPAGGGPEQLVLFLVPRGKRESTDSVKRQCQAAIRSKLNPLFKVERVCPEILL